MPSCFQYRTAIFTVTSPVAGAHLDVGTVVTVEVAAVSGSGSVTSVQFFAEGKLVDERPAPPYVFAWTTASSGAGRVGLQALAKDDAGGSALSEVVPVRVTADGDGDGLPDYWEWRHFKSESLYTGTDDPDGEGVDNLGEFRADTVPTDPLSRFSVLDLAVSETNDDVSLTFVSSTSRFYRVSYHDGPLTAPAGWDLFDEPAFRGDPGTSSWQNANAPPATNDHRYFRVRAHVP